MLNRSIPDVESRFYDRLTTATRSTRGTAGVMMVVVALLLATFLFSLWLRGGPDFWTVENGLRSVARTLGSSPDGPSLSDAVADFVAGVGVVVAVPLASGYAVWYWLRELRRSTALESDSKVALVARPPGLPVAVTALTAGWFAHATGPLDEAAFAVGWPPLALVLCWSVRVARRAEPTPPTETRWTVPVGFVVYTVGVVAFLDVRPRMFLGIVFPVWLFYLGKMNDRATDLRGSFALVGYGAVLFLGVFALREPLDVGFPELAVVGGVVVALAGGQVFSRVFHPDE